MLLLLNKLFSIKGTIIQRPRGPPPPAPSPRLSNGQSTESIASLTSDHADSSNPVPPPRKVEFF